MEYLKEATAYSRNFPVSLELMDSFLTDPSLWHVSAVLSSTEITSDFFLVHASLTGLPLLGSSIFLKISNNFLVVLSQLSKKSKVYYLFMGVTISLLSMS